MRSKAGTSRLGSRARLSTVAIGSALLLGLATRGAAYSGSDPIETYDNNPCTGPERQQLRCPNLRMSRPSDLYISVGPSGRRLLHARSSINSRGRGPMQIRGIRIPGTRLMRVNQR